jgi:hypothetical protein
MTKPILLATFESAPNAEAITKASYRATQEKDK